MPIMMRSLMMRSFKEDDGGAAALPMLQLCDYCAA
jgi:hypothetical protein